MGEDVGVREARYAEAAMRRSPNGPWMTLPGPTDIALSFVRAVLPLVDAEVAAAVSETQAEVQRLRQEIDECWVPLYHGALNDAESAEAEVEAAHVGGFTDAADTTGTYASGNDQQGETQ